MNNHFYCILCYDRSDAMEIELKIRQKSPRKNALLRKCVLNMEEGIVENALKRREREGKNTRTPNRMAHGKHKIK